MFEKNPEHPLAKYHLKHGTVKKDTTNFTDNKNKKMEVGRKQPEKKQTQISQNRHQNGTLRDIENGEDQRTPRAEDFTPN